MDSKLLEHKLPPQNQEAEKSVLGGLLLEQEAWDEVSDLLNEEDFYKPAHRKIYAAIRDLHRKQMPSDLVTVSNLLMEKGDLETVGGAAALAEMIDQTPSAANILSYAKIVHEKSLLRRVIQTSQGFITKAFEGDFESMDAFMDTVESNIFHLTESSSQGGLVDASSLVKTSLEKLESLYGQQLTVTGIPTGFAELDDMTSGFQPGELIVIAARPSMGKT
ncbi:MAG TPA: replicative DNA helicase, partial [Bdellovibrionales bacterium]|nr:replicative DNA helicase [Bdellovibrionales bacterium]